MTAALAAIAGLVTALAAFLAAVLPYLKRRRRERAHTPAPAPPPPSVRRGRLDSADISGDASAHAFLASERAARLDRQRVLVVDDDPAIRHVIARVMRGPRFEGVELFEASSFEAGRAALAAAAGDPFDVVLLDQVLPDGHGWNLIKLVPRTGTALLVMSGRLDGDIMAELATFALGERLDKPFHLDQLEDALLRGLGRA